MNISKKMMVLAISVVMCLALCIGVYAAEVASSSTTDLNYESLQEAIDATEEGGTVTLLADFTISEAGAVESSTGAKNFGAIINKSMTLNGAGYTITGGSASLRAVLGIKGGDYGNTVYEDQIDVTITGLTVNADKCNMAVEDRGNVANLTIQNSNFYASNKKAYTQPLTIGGIEDEINVDIDNCNIWTDEAASKYYAIMIWSPVTMTITDSDIRGWACLYFKDGSNGANVSITNSYLKSQGISGTSNNFAMITAEDDNVQVTITSSEVDLGAADNTYQAIVLPASGYVDDAETVTVAVEGNTTLNFTGEYAVAALGSPEESVEFATDTQFSFENADMAIEDVNFYLPEDKKLEVAGNGSATIVDDPAASIGGTTYLTLEEAFAAAQDGDTITLLRDASGNGIKAPTGKFQPQGLTVDFGGKTYDVIGTLVGSTGTETLGFQLLKDNTITFKNGTVTASNPGCKMLIQNYSNLTLDNMVVDGTGDLIQYAVSNNNGETLIKDSTINANASGVAFDVWYGFAPGTYDVVKVTVENSTINGDVEFGAGAKTTPEQLAAIGEKFGLTISDNSTVNGDLVNSSYSTKANAVAAVADDLIEIDATSTLTGENTFEVAMINGTKYATLEAAFAAAQDGDTIVLLKDASGNGIKVPVGTFQEQGLTVDFAGYTYTVNGTLVGSNNTANQCFQLLKDNTITFKDGTITVDNSKVSWKDKDGNTRNGAAMIIQNYSNLTLDNMIIDGTAATVNYAVSNNNGETTIKNSTINSHDGGVAFDVWFGMDPSYTSVSVAVENSTINGTVEYGASTKAATAETIPTNMSLTITDSTIHGDIVNSSAAALADAVEEAAATTLTIEDSVIDGANVFDVSKTLVVYNMEKTEAGDIQIAVFAGVDSLNYERAGFEINGVVYTTRWVSTSVNVQSEQPGVSHVYEAAEFGDGAQYVFGDIITVNDDEPLTIRAFVIDFAGNVTYNTEVVLEDPYTLVSISGGGQNATGGSQNPPLIPGLGG